MGQNLNTRKNRFPGPFSLWRRHLRQEPPTPSVSPGAMTHVVGYTPDTKALFERLSLESTACRETVAGVENAWPFAEYLLMDLFHIYYLEHVRLQTDVDPALHRHITFVTELLRLSTFADVRRWTVGSPQAALLAAIHAVSSLQGRPTSGHDPDKKESPPATTERDLRGWLKHKLTLFKIKPDKYEETSIEDGHDEINQDRSVLYSALHASKDAADVMQDLHRIRGGLFPGKLRYDPVDKIDSVVREIRALPDFKELLTLMADLRNPAPRLGRGKVAGQRQRRVSGLQPGKDLERVAPFELARLADKEMESLFDEAYEHGRLFVYTYKDDTPKQGGAIFCCVDTSSSMNQIATRGISRFLWGKAFALALLHMADQQKRPFVGMCFSGPGDLEVFHAPEGKMSEEETVRFLKCDFDGGTHLDTPLQTSLDYPEQHPMYGKADVIVLTDGEGALSSRIRLASGAAIDQGRLQLYSVFIDGYNEHLATLSHMVVPVSSADESAWRHAISEIGRSIRP